MTALVLEVHLRLIACHSLKDKRHRILPLMERLRKHFGASVAEIGDNDLWGNALIGIAIVSSSESAAKVTSARVSEYFDSLPDLELYMEMSEIVVL